MSGDFDIPPVCHGIARDFFQLKLKNTVDNFLKPENYVYQHVRGALYLGSS